MIITFQKKNKISGKIIYSNFIVAGLAWSKMCSTCS